MTCIGDNGVYPGVSRRLLVIPRLTRRQEEVLLELTDAGEGGRELRGPEKRIGLYLGRKGLASWLPSERRYFLTARGREVAAVLVAAKA